MQSQFYGIAALSAVVFQFLPIPLPLAIAQEHEGCFMINASGELVNLSSLCDTEDRRPVLTPEQLKAREFIEAYTQAANEYEPPLKDFLLREIRRVPQQKIRTAQTICQEAKEGISIPEWRLRTRVEAVEIADPRKQEEFIADRDLTISLATNYYCPEFANR